MYLEVKKMKRFVVIIIVFLTLIASLIWIPDSKTNYDMTLYLPEDSMTSEGIQVLNENFDVSSSIQLMIEDISVEDVIMYKSLIQSMELVDSVIWLDDYVDIQTIPLEWIPVDTLSQFYNDQNALLTIVFTTDSYDIELEPAIEDIRLLFDEEIIRFRGEPIENIRAKEVAEGEIFKILVLIIPIILIILLLASHAWIEPVLILIALGIAVLFNVFTNGIFEHVSFITKSMALALQLALSIDYALFLIHRFYEERMTYDPIIAAKRSVIHAFKSITTSALTTIAGFTALFLMDYSIGLDIGLVLSKGILFSYLSTLIVLPILLVWFSPIIDQSKHRMLLPNFRKLFLFQHRFRYGFIIVLIALIGTGLFFQSKATYLFGTTSLSSESDPTQQDQMIISEQFGSYQQMILLVPNETVDQEISLVTDLLLNPNITSVNALVTTVDPMIPRSMLPSDLLQSYVGPTHSRIIIQTTILDEQSTMFPFISDLDNILSSHYDTYYYVGTYSAIHDIQSSIMDQELVITLLSILAVGLIIGLMFKSISLPIILIGVIQTAVWLNVSYLYWMDISVFYIGYLVVMSLQLGATIDYAVLLTSRYIEHRKSMNPKEAMTEAFSKSSISILISGVILTVAGFAEGLFSDIQSVTEIGMLLGRGALISSLLVFLFLPTTLVALDSIIMKSTWTEKLMKPKRPKS
jgi:uncharacterized protein